MDNNKNENAWTSPSQTNNNNKSPKQISLSSFAVGVTNDLH